MRSRSLRRVLTAAVASVALLAPTAVAAEAAPKSATVYSRDGQWRVDVNAFKNYLFVYSSIGTEVSVYHWERVRRWWEPWNNSFGWVSRPAGSITINNRYSGLLPSLNPAIATRSAQAFNRDYLEEKLWAFGIGVSVDASAGSGLPDPGTAGPCCGASLDVRSVEGTATVTIGNEVLSATVGTP